MMQFYRILAVLVLALVCHLYARWQARCWREVTIEVRIGDRVEEPMPVQEFAALAGYRSVSG